MLQTTEQFVSSSVYYFPGVTRSNEIFDFDKVVAMVSDAMHVNKEYLFIRCRKPNVKFARWLVWKIMYSHGYTYLQCAKAFNKDHTTVMYAMQFIDRDIEQIPHVSMAWGMVSKYYKPKRLMYNANKKQLN